MICCLSVLPCGPLPALFCLTGYLYCSLILCHFILHCVVCLAWCEISYNVIVLLLYVRHVRCLFLLMINTVACLAQYVKAKLNGLLYSNKIIKSICKSENLPCLFIICNANLLIEQLYYFLLSDNVKNIPKVNTKSFIEIQPLVWLIHF